MPVTRSVNNVSPRRSNRSNRTSLANMSSFSYMTVLRPREYTPSDILSVFSNFFVSIHETETWVQRAQLTFRVMGFCLGPGNIWRFPEQAFRHGAASYVYLYIIYNFVLCVSLLVFELSLSQYFVKGFAKMFTLCPVMEGITLAMTAYCIMANLLYSLVATYSIIYTFSAMQGVLPHSYCWKHATKCLDNATNITFAPETDYFYQHVERAADAYLGDKYNWRNACVLAFIWFFMCIVIASGFLRHHWISIALSFAVFFCLLYSAIISARLNGAGDGLFRMFVPKPKDIGYVTTWIYAAEQAIVTLGVGAGPLTTIWSVSKIRYWFRRDCVIVMVVAMICSLLSGMVYFSAAGVMARKYNMTVEDVMELPKKVHTYTLVVPMFNTLPSGLSHFTVAFFYLVMFLSCFYSLIEYTQIIIMYIGSYISIKHIRMKIIGLVGVVSYSLIVIVGVNQVSFPLLMAINDKFIATSLLIIISFEITSVSLFYGLYNFCDDIEFMLNFTPNLYFQVTWMVFPGLFAVIAVASLYVKFYNLDTIYDAVAITCTIVFTLVAILSVALFKCIVGTKSVGFRRAINPRYDEENFPSPVDSNSEQNNISNNPRYSPVYNPLYATGT